MSILGIERQAARRIIGCLALSALCAILSHVYQRFGHGVTSWAMTNAFFVPLVGGALHLLLWELIKHPDSLQNNMRHCQNVLFAGLSALTAGLYLHGIVEIAGVESYYPPWFIVFGAALTLAATIRLWLFPRA